MAQLEVRRRRAPRAALAALLTLHALAPVAVASPTLSPTSAVARWRIECSDGTSRSGNVPFTDHLGARAGSRCTVVVENVGERTTISLASEPWACAAPASSSLGGDGEQFHPEAASAATRGLTVEMPVYEAASAHETANGAASANETVNEVSPPVAYAIAFPPSAPSNGAPLLWEVAHGTTSQAASGIKLYQAPGNAEPSGRPLPAVTPETVDKAARARERGRSSAPPPPISSPTAAGGRAGSAWMRETADGPASVRRLSADVSVQQMNDSTTRMNDTAGPAACADRNDHFADFSSITPLWNDCSGALGLSVVYFPSVGLGGVCSATVREWSAACSLSAIAGFLALTCSVAEKGPNATMAELCPATCAAEGVHAEGCGLPLPSPSLPPGALTPPPSSPALPPGGATATTAEALRSELATARLHGRVDIYVPAGETLYLGGAPLVVGAHLNVTIRSEGHGAVLDASSLSRVFEVRPRGRLLMRSLTLINGHAALGGAILVLQGAVVQLSQCSLRNSSALKFGGAAAVLDGWIELDACAIISCSTSGGVGAGGAFMVSSSSLGGSAGCITLRGCNVTHCTAPLGGAAFVYMGSLMAIGCEFSHMAAPSPPGFATGWGGVLNNQYGFQTMSGCTIAHTRAAMWGGVSWGDFSAFDCEITNATAGEIGGILFGSVGATISGCLISGCRAGLNGGVLVYANDMSISHSRITLCHAACGGVLAWSTVAISNSEISDCTATSAGGVAYDCASLTVSGSTISRATVQNAYVDRETCQGGAINTGSGTTVITDGSVIEDSFASYGGGAMCIHGPASVTVSGGSSIMRSTAQYGGAFFIGGAASLTISGSSVSLSAAVSGEYVPNPAGGCAALFGGSVTVINSTISNSSAHLRGGAFFIETGTGGKVNLSRSSVVFSTTLSSFVDSGGGAIHSAQNSNGMIIISDSKISYSTSATSGGAIELRGGTLICTRSVMEFSSALGFPYLIGGQRNEVARGTDVLDIRGDTLVVLTLVEVRQRTCSSGSIWSQEADAAIVLRQVTLTLPDGDSSCSHGSAGQYSLRPMGCGERYTDPTTGSSALCASGSPGACSAQPMLAGSAIESVTCQCPFPEFAEPADPALAPYLPSGCINPMQLTGIRVVARSVTAALTKPTEPTRSLNVTLLVEGTDTVRPASWAIVDAQALLARSPWLSLPELGGEDTSIVAGETQVIVPLALSASGLRERTAAYVEQVSIHVSSAVAAVAKTGVLDISLTVQAATSLVVWGRLRWDTDVQQRCSPSVEAPPDSRLVAGELRRVPFTACDAEAIPVDHQLPSQSDLRRFSALLFTGNHIVIT